MSDKYPQITRFISETPWMVLPEVYGTIQEIVSLRRQGTKLSAEDIRMQLGGEPPEKQLPVQAQGIAVIPLQGVIMPKADMMTEMSGGTSLETFTNQVKAAVNDPAVTQILLNVDSPGGSTAMVPETAAIIREANHTKPVVAFVEGMACSAAYYLASQADTIVSTPSGLVGSIGVYMGHQDISEKQHKEGIKTTLIHAGKYKVDGSEFEPLTPEAKAHFQGLVDDLYDGFLEAVAIGRGTTAEKVHNHFGEGRTVTPTAALAAGMIDKIDTFENVLGGMLSIAPAQAALTYSKAVADLATHMECVDLEHSEPGTGSPPAPVDMHPEKDKAIKGWWRTDTPEDFRPSEQSKEGSIVNEQLIALCSKVGIKVEEADTDDVLVTKLSDALDGMKPESVTAVQDSPSFKEQFPEAFAEMETLKAKDIVHEAKEFSSAYTQIGQKGFSALMTEKVEQAHMAVTSGTFSSSDLRELLDTAVKSVVDYSEKGSNLDPEAKTFTDYVKDTQAANPDMSYGDCVAKAQIDFPEAAAQWRAVKPA